MQNRIAKAVTAAFLLPVASSALAQDRSNDNAVTQAEDAFGFSVGRESIGIYNAGQTRGFSPTAAGNVRVDGLYYDGVFGVSGMLIGSSSVKVGLSAQGYPFAAPSGIYDQTLRRPAPKFGASLITSGTSWGEWGVEVDGSGPVTSTLGFGFGLGAGHTVYPNFTDNQNRSAALYLRWKPTDRIEVIPFWSTYINRGDEVGTYYLPGGDYIPKVDRARHDESPRWADINFVGASMGVVSSAALGKNTVARLGLFRSTNKTTDSFSFVIADIQPDGTGERLLFADPDSFNRSYSGEARLTHSIPDGPRLHIFHLSARGRNSKREFGGGDVISYGIGPVGERITAPRPESFDFGEQTRVHTRQGTFGVAYDGRWKDVGEFSASLARAEYDKTTRLADGTSVEAKDQPWLYNATLAIVASRAASFYAGYARGFEESGTAPTTAANRNEPLPSIITEQKDVGVRVDLAQGMRAVAGLFDLTRPYFGFDQANRFDQVGTVRSRGAEFSVSGKPTANLNMLLGGVFFRPRVTRSADAVGDVGKKPSGLPAHIVNLNLNWTAPFLKGLQLDAGIQHRGRTPTTVNNRVSFDPRLFANVGARYGFKLGERDSSLRFQVQNLFDNRGETLGGPGVYGPRGSRLFNLSLTIDS